MHFGFWNNYRLFFAISVKKSYDYVTQLDFSQTVLMAFKHNRPELIRVTIANGLGKINMSLAENVVCWRPLHLSELEAPNTTSGPHK